LKTAARTGNWGALTALEEMSYSTANGVYSVGWATNEFTIYGNAQTFNYSKIPPKIW
jgi:hypothetical protein